MKFVASDLKRIRLPLAVCAVLAIAGAACYVAADDYLQKSRTLATGTSAQRAEIQARLASANEEEREIKANLQQYQALAARGVIGEEKRLDWIDALTAIKSERRLFNIRYSIEPQRELDYPGFAAIGGVQFLASSAKIEMLLLHEEDLLDFIDDLNKRSKLYLSARRCEIKRTDRAGGGPALVPRLQADCVFDLITIRNIKPV